IGVTVSTTVMSGGMENVLAGGMASATTVAGGGKVGVYADAGVLDGLVNGIVQAVGSTLSTTVGSGGEEDVLLGGIASALTVSGGGLGVVSSGGTSLAAVVSRLFPYTTLFRSIGVTVSTTVMSGGMENVLAGGMASATTVAGGGKV